MQSERLAAKAWEHGYRWLALEIDDFGNANHWPWFRDACLSRGIKPGTWVTDGRNLGRWEPGDSEFMIAEDEGPGDRQGIFDAIQRGLPPKPKAVIGNGWRAGTAGGQMQPAVDAGFHFITECYARTDDGRVTGYTPDGLAWNCHTYLGFPYERIQPCFGRFGGAQESDYAQWKGANLGWSDYSVEGVLVNA